MSQVSIASPDAVAVPPAPEPVEMLAIAIQSCPGVSSLSGGTFGEVATYLPGRRVRGIRLTDRTVEIHIVAFWGQPLPEVAAQIRGLSAPFAGARSIDVYVDDLNLPETTALQG